MKKMVALLVAVLVTICSVATTFAHCPCYGDTNSNGQIDIIDVTNIQQHIARIITLDDDVLEAIDVDGDGMVAILDCTSVQCYIAKVIDHFPVEEQAHNVPAPTEPETEPETEPATEPTQAPVDDTQPNEMELEILRLVNIERTSRGIDPLVFGYDYYDCAKIRAQECNNIDWFSHTRPDGRQWYTVFDDLNKPSYWQAGENLALYLYSAEHVVEGWMNSPGHRANILNPTFDSMAVAICETEEYPGYYSAAQLFVASWDRYYR